MNEQEALKEISAALDKWFTGDETEYNTLARIARITGHYAGTQ